MNRPNFQSERREALRQQLISLPTQAHPQRNRRADFKGRGQCSGSWAVRRDDKRRLRIWFGVAVVATATAAGATALMTAPEDRLEDASRIIETLSRPQTAEDMVAPTVLKRPEGIGIDPAETRFLGRSPNYTYFGAPAKEARDMPANLSGNRICIIAAPIDGRPASVGCTLLKTFESAGLKVESPDRKEAAWLVVPAGMKDALASVANEIGWTQEGPNLLIRSTS